MLFCILSRQGLDSTVLLSAGNYNFPHCCVFSTVKNYLQQSNAADNEIMCDTTLPDELGMFSAVTLMY